MTGTVVAVGLVAVLVPAAIWSRRAGRRWLGTVLGVVAVTPALVAVRGLPVPVIDGLLLAALLVVAVVTAWPLLRRSGERADRGGRGGGS